MFSPTDFNDAVPQFTNGNYASNPLNPLYIEEPGAIDYNRGVEPLQTLPAQWWNWLANQFTAKFNKVNIYVKNIFDELTQLLSLFGITPDATEGTITTGQIKSAFQNNYPAYVADKPPILKTENEVLSADRYSVDSLNIKYASTANITPLYGIQTVDGATPTDGDYLLLKDQTDETENGIYEYSELGDWTRVTGYTTPANLLKKIFNVKNGTANAGKMFYLSNTVFEDGTAFGTDDIVFTEYFGSIAPNPSTTVVRDATGHVKTADPVEADDAINLRSAALALYPVGTIYWTGKAPNDGGDPNVLFGGTWVQIKDQFILAAGDTYTLNSTGGSATVTLTIDQIPSHYHTTDVFHRHYSDGSTSGMVRSDNNTGGSFRSRILSNGVGEFDSNAGFTSISSVYDTGVGGGASFATGTMETYRQDISFNVQHTHTCSGWSNNAIYNASQTRIDGTDNTWKVNSDSKGSGQAHNNMPPYIVKYCWERTA